MYFFQWGDYYFICVGKPISVNQLRQINFRILCIFFNEAITILYVWVWVVYILFLCCIAMFQDLVLRLASPRMHRHVYMDVFLYFCRCIIFKWRKYCGWCNFSILCDFAGVLYFVSSTVNPILYNLMSRKYRQAFKETLCRCCLTEAERHSWRGGRTQFQAERSTYTTFTASRTTTHNHSSSQKRQSAASLKTIETTPKSTGNGTLRQSTSSRWTLWKVRLFGPKSKRETRGFSSPVNSIKKVGGQRMNGNCSDESRSASSSPGLMAAHIKEEMEMDSMLQRNVVYPVIGEAGQGTML